MADFESTDIKGDFGEAPGAFEPITGGGGGTTIVDSFSGTDGDNVNGRTPDTINNGNVWQAVNADIQGNRLRLGAAATDHAMIDLTIKDVNFEFIFNPGGANNRYIFHYCNDGTSLGSLPQNGYVVLFPIGSNAPPFFSRYSGGVQFPLGTPNSFDFTDLNADYAVRLRSNTQTGLVELYVNSTLVATAIDGESSATLGTLIGFDQLQHTTNAARVDDVNATSFSSTGSVIVDGFSGVNGADVNGRLPDTTNNGNVWAAVGADIQNNQMRIGTALTNYALIDLGIKDVDFRFDFNPGGVANRYWIHICNDGTDNGNKPDNGYGFVLPIGNTGGINLFRWSAGVETLLSVGSLFDFTDLNATYQVQFKSNTATGLVETIVNSVLINSALDTEPKGPLGTLIGFDKSNDTGDQARVDNVDAKPFTPSNIISADYSVSFAQADNFISQVPILAGQGAGVGAFVIYVS